MLGPQLGVTAHDQGAAIGRREIYVEHLHGSELVKHGPRREASRHRFEPCAQRDVQTIGQEGDEDVRLDALFELMVDWAQLQIVLHGLEGSLDLDELDIELPQRLNRRNMRINLRKTEPMKRDLVYTTGDLPDEPL